MTKQHAVNLLLALLLAAALLLALPLLNSNLPPKPRPDDAPATQINVTVLQLDDLMLQPPPQSLPAPPRPPQAPPPPDAPPPSPPAPRTPAPPQPTLPPKPRPSLPLDTLPQASRLALPAPPPVAFTVRAPAELPPPHESAEPPVPAVATQAPAAPPAAPAAETVPRDTVTDVAERHLVRPRFPAQSPRVSGTIELAFTIDSAGNVSEVSIVSCSPQLNASYRREAIRAAKRSTYRPKTVNGIPVSSRARRRIDFIVP